MNEIAALEGWLDAALSIRHLCENKSEFDALVAEYTHRLATLCWAFE